MKTTNSSPIIGMAGTGTLFLLLAFLYQGWQKAEQAITQMPITGIQTVVQAKIEEPKQDMLKLLSPLLRESKNKVEAYNLEQASIDNAFKAYKPKEQISSDPEVPVIVDGFTLLEGNIQLTAVMQGRGAFLNGKYYPVGTELTIFSYQVPTGETVVPILAGVGLSSATLKEKREQGRILSLSITK